MQIMLEGSPENMKPYLTLSPFRSAFADAVRSGKYEISRILLEAGADINRDYDHTLGPTLLSLAVHSRNVEMVRTVLEFRPDLHTGDADGNTALHRAAESTSVEIVWLIVNAGCALDALNKKGSSPLSNAVKQSNLAVVKYILTKASALRTLNLVGNDNNIPLHLACQDTNTEIVPLLLAKGADPNLRSTGTIGGTPLVFACLHKGYFGSKYYGQSHV